MEQTVEITDDLIKEVMQLSNLVKVTNWLKEICVYQQKEIKMLKEQIEKLKK